jgi:hypothetical protein
MPREAASSAGSPQNTFQLSDEREIHSNRLYWISNYQESILTLSRKTKGEAILRKCILKALWSFQKEHLQIKNSVQVFGGIVRRMIRADYHVQEVFNKTPKIIVEKAIGLTFEDNNSTLPPAHLPSSCFVKVNSDIDIFFLEQKDVQSFMLYLKYDFKVETFKYSQNELYAGCKVLKILVEPKMQLHDPKIVICLDLVCKLHSDCMLSADFDVNSLQMDSSYNITRFGEEFSAVTDLKSATKELVKTASIINKIQNGTATLVLYSWLYYRCFMFKHCEACETFRSTENECEESEEDEDSVEDEDSEKEEHFKKDEHFEEDDTDSGENKDELDLFLGNDESLWPHSTLSRKRLEFYYRRYLKIMIRSRLAKMVRENYTVTNLELPIESDPTESEYSSRKVLMSCGHFWNFDGVMQSYRVNNSVGSSKQVFTIECAKLECKTRELLFSDFIDY